MNTCEMFCAACIGGVWLAFTTPRQTMPFVKPAVVVRGIDERGDEAVVRHVVRQRRVQPGADLLASAVDIAGAAIVVAQQVVPEAEPVFGVTAIVIKETRDEPIAFVGPRVARQTREPLSVMAARQSRRE